MNDAIIKPIISLDRSHMKVLITGATGLVGSALIEKIITQTDYQVSILTRSPNKENAKFTNILNVYKWDIDQNFIDPMALENVDVIINLAGEGIANRRWSEEQKERIYNSRIQGTKLLVKQLQKNQIFPKIFINASAIGFYGSQNDKELTEKDPGGDDFLATVCQDWENTLLTAKLNQTQKYILRLGLVLSEKGGALAKMLPAFKAGIAGKLGAGTQYMSWIHLEDLTSQILFLMQNKPKGNLFNCVSPSPMTNNEFTKSLGAQLKRPTFFPAPKLLLKTALGEMSQLLLASQKVLPKEFMANGYEFSYPSLEQALSELLKKDKKGEKNLTYYQWIDKPPQEVFPFFSEASNLETITPDFLGFKILNKSTASIKTGTIINYKLKLHGIPLKWKTEILDFQQDKFFIDNQIKGPYKKWLHKHSFVPYRKGTLIIDDITYKLPLGKIGHLFAGHFVAKDVQKIFTFRQNTLKKVFK